MCIVTVRVAQGISVAARGCAGVGNFSKMLPTPAHPQNIHTPLPWDASDQSLSWCVAGYPVGGPGWRRRPER